MSTSPPPTQQPAWRSIATVFAMIGVLGLAIVPLPAFMLDLLLGASLCLSLLIFLVALHVEKPLEFSSFPSTLLMVTLLRLALNIASTRRILLHGGEGLEAAGGVIHAFGEFAVGGNFVVGAVVFLILVVINFIVITKGAERISEVAARFTLDSMPGKQMAIDADLGAGLINDKEARARRANIEHEADFHGSMDGASKFVRGDAIAGLLIVGINIIGGMIIGVAQQGMSFGDAAKTFTTLSIGEGLVSQLPALLISTGAALLTTRGSAAGVSAGQQLFSRSQATQAAGAILGALGLVPGMPHISFLALAGGAFWLAKKTSDDQKAALTPVKAGGTAAPKANDPAAQKQEIETILPLELLSLEVGLDLLPLVDAARSGELLGRIAGLRKQMAVELGLMVPLVHVKDDLRLKPGGYRLLISGVKVGEGEVRASRLLAISPGGNAIANLQGEQVREPTFGLPARWIASADRNKAEALGCTVVDPSAVIATHLTEVVRRHAHELMGRREAQELLELAGKTNGKVVEELVPHLLPLGEVIKVLKLLLQEGISIRDLRTILETLADHAAKVKEPEQLVELVRQRLARQITGAQLTASGELRALVLDPRAEELFRGGRGADANALSRLAAAIETAARQSSERDEPPLLVVAPDVRRQVSAVVQRYAPGMSVMSYRELDPSVPFVTRGVVGAANDTGKPVAKLGDGLFAAPR
jgi:flagellar biosynthesis protein FlhA